MQEIIFILILILTPIDFSRWQMPVGYPLVYDKKTFNTASECYRKAESEILKFKSIIVNPERVEILPICYPYIL